MSRKVQQFMVGVKGFITKGDEVLVVKSGFGRENLWEVPGGRYDQGEESLAPEEILRREISEELGEKFECTIDAPSSAWVRPLNEHFVFLLSYVCTYVKGEIKLSYEHTEYRWVGRDDWQGLDLAPGYRQALDQYWKNR